MVVVVLEALVVDSSPCRITHIGGRSTFSPAHWLDEIFGSLGHRPMVVTYLEQLEGACHSAVVQICVAWSMV